MWSVTGMLSLVGFILIAFVLYFVKDLPTLYRALKVEQTKASNSQELQREAYFREVGGKDLARLFKDWTAFLYNSDKKVKSFDADKAVDLISRTVIYGSTRTINLCALYTRDLYAGVLDSEANNDDLSYATAKTLLYFGYIVSSLKFDFTGYEVDPLNLLQMKINDLSEVQKTENFKNALADIKCEDVRM